MTMTEQQRQEFEAVTRPVIEWLNVNCHPHVTVVIEPTKAELSEGTIEDAAKGSDTTEQCCGEPCCSDAIRKLEMKS